MLTDDFLCWKMISNVSDNNDSGSDSDNKIKQEYSIAKKMSKRRFVLIET